MNDILHKYTANELLRWLTDLEIDMYILPVVEEDDEGNTYTISLLDVDSIEKDFIRSVRRFEVVKRGSTLFIHDNKSCQDILSWTFTEKNREYIQNTANMTCESLNNSTMRFIGQKERCW